VVIGLERGADLHMAQVMPLPLTVSCFSKIQIGFTFLVPADPGSPGKRAIKRVCVCVGGDTVDNTAEENSNVFALIRTHWLPAAMVCVREKSAPTTSSSS